jgi:hypothetical protein
MTVSLGAGQALYDEEATTAGGEQVNSAGDGQKKTSKAKTRRCFAGCFSAAQPYYKFGGAGEASGDPRQVLGVAASTKASNKLRVRYHGSHAGHKCIGIFICFLHAVRTLVGATCQEYIAVSDERVGAVCVTVCCDMQAEYSVIH